MLHSAYSDIEPRTLEMWVEGRLGALVEEVDELLDERRFFNDLNRAVSFELLSSEAVTEESRISALSRIGSPLVLHQPSSGLTPGMVTHLILPAVQMMRRRWSSFDAARRRVAQVRAAENAIRTQAISRFGKQAQSQIEGLNREIKDIEEEILLLNKKPRNSDSPLIIRYHDARNLFSSAKDNLARGLPSRLSFGGYLLLFALLLGAEAWLNYTVLSQQLSQDFSLALLYSAAVAVLVGLGSHLLGARHKELLSDLEPPQKGKDSFFNNWKAGWRAAWRMYRRPDLRVFGGSLLYLGAIMILTLSRLGLLFAGQTSAFGGGTGEGGQAQAQDAQPNAGEAAQGVLSQFDVTGLPAFLMLLGLNIVIAVIGVALSSRHHSARRELEQAGSDYKDICEEIRHQTVRLNEALRDRRRTRDILMADGLTQEAAMERVASELSLLEARLDDEALSEQEAEARERVVRAVEAYALALNERLSTTGLQTIKLRQGSSGAPASEMDMGEWLKGFSSEAEKLVNKQAFTRAVRNPSESWTPDPWAPVDA